MTDTFKRGDTLILSSGEKHVRATVTLASENGRSLMVEFDGSINTVACLCCCAMTAYGNP